MLSNNVSPLQEFKFFANLLDANIVENNAVLACQQANEGILPTRLPRDSVVAAIFDQWHSRHPFLSQLPQLSTTVDPGALIRTPENDET